MTMELDVDKTALALLHFQKDICEAGGPMAPEEAEAIGRFSTAINRTETLLAAARHAQLPILYSAFGRSRSGTLANRHGQLYTWIAQSGGCIEGEAGHAFVDRLIPQDGDIVTRCPGISAFAGSTFGQELAGSGVRTLLVTGITTHWAVEGTVREAADRGYDCVVISDCVASANQATHDGALERLGFIARVTDSESVAEALSPAR